MIKEEKILKEITTRKKYCDVCESKIPIGLDCSKSECEYCGKDLCENCIGHEEEETGGDYRIVFCKTCWDIGKVYRPIIKKRHNEIDTLYETWRSLCKK